MKLKKLLSIILSIGMVGGMPTVFAEPCGNVDDEIMDLQPKTEGLQRKMQMLTLSNKIWREAIKKGGGAFTTENYFKTQKAIFENHSPGLFVINPTAIRTVDHFLLAMNIECINSIFTEYPNITKYLAKKLQLTNGKLEINSDESRFAISSKYGFGVTQSISLNPRLYSDFEAIPAVGYNSYQALTNIEMGFFSPAEECNLPVRMVLHEIGYLLEMNYPYFPMFDVAQESKALGLRPMEDTSFDSLKWRAIKIEIIKIAKEKYGYEGTGFISNYGAYNDARWFAEVFAHAWGSREPNALGKAMLDWLYEKDKDIAKFV